MTAKELKKILKEVPDDTLITIVGEDGDGNGVEEYAMGAVYEEEAQQLYINY